jgi:hypothetical protein
MKFLKTYKINSKEVKDESIVYRNDGQIIMDSVVSLRLPTGKGDPKFSPGTAENQRPGVPYDQNGLLRYNTDLDAMEILTEGIWYQIKTKKAAAIVSQQFRPIQPGENADDIWVDGVERFFGPLKGQNQERPYFDPTSTPATGAANILVYIENVPQIPYTNYELIESTGITIRLPNRIYPDGLYIKFFEPVPDNKIVTVLLGFD